MIHVTMLCTGLGTAGIKYTEERKMKEAVVCMFRSSKKWLEKKRNYHCFGAIGRQPPALIL